MRIWNADSANDLEFYHGISLGTLPAHDVAQFLQVSRGEVPVVPVAPLYVLVNPMQVQSVQVQELLLQTPGSHM